MDRRMIVVALGVVLMGTSAGYALGGYATGGQSSTPVTERPPWWHEDEAAESGAATPATPPADMVATSDAPEQYVCHGCGPTLAQRRTQSLWKGDSAEAAYDTPQPDPEEGTPL